jgi:alkylated DNA nucleotide flippase Atl1
VARAKRQLEEARAELHAAIKAAVASGETYRDVARMAGLSHQRVSQIVKEE